MRLLDYDSVKIPSLPLWFLFWLESEVLWAICYESLFQCKFNFCRLVLKSLFECKLVVKSLFQCRLVLKSLFQCKLVLKSLFQCKLVMKVYSSVNWL